MNDNSAQSAEDKVRALIDQAAREAYKEVEKRARAAIRDSKSPAFTFCMAMGTATFYDEEGPIMVDFPYPKWAEPTLAFIDEFDSELKLTGKPMRIAGWNAPLVTDW